jgi:hypothetical protein
MIDPKIVVLEHVTSVAPLGLRFVDAATGHAIGAGLNVFAAPANVPTRRTQAFPNRVGIYAARGLHGLSEAERGSGDAGFWSSPPGLRRFSVEVSDQERRFLPCQFELALPAHGLAAPSCLPPTTPSDPTSAGVPLFSAPSRPIPAGLAAVRAEVWDEATGKPAAWALLEVAGAGMPATRGLADERGCGVVIFPYPEPELFGVGSTPGGAALLGQRWNLTLRVFAMAHGDWGLAPDLCRVLEQADAPPRSEVPVTLIYGQEAIVATQPGSMLLLPAGSPA